VDGAMVPLRQQEGAEVKTLALGTVGKPVCEGGEWGVPLEALCYFSRLTAAETFGRPALVETPRCGTETARTVCAVSDEAEWMQRFVDLHRSEAVRILDFPPALGSVAHAGQAVYGEDTHAFTRWFATQRHACRHGDPEEVLRARRRLAARAARRGPAQGGATVQESLGYLQKRRGRLDDAWFHAWGYPLGSGAVERANELVVGARLKGAGRHWARAYVNPTVALRTIACRDRWAEAWLQMAQAERRQAWQAQRQHQELRQAKQPPTALHTMTASDAMGRTAAPSPITASVRPPTSPSLASLSPKAPYRPPPDHPWRRFRLGRAMAQPPGAASVAKL
jgi:hypothetical protein